MTCVSSFYFLSSNFGCQKFPALSRKYPRRFPLHQIHVQQLPSTYKKHSEKMAKIAFSPLILLETSCDVSQVQRPARERACQENWGRRQPPPRDSSIKESGLWIDLGPWTL